jgi:hypothetical protein
MKASSTTPHASASRSRRIAARKLGEASAGRVREQVFRRAPSQDFDEERPPALVALNVDGGQRVKVLK